MPVTGGDRLERHLQGMANNLAKANSVRVGFFQGSTYPDGTPVAMVAAIQEYGAPKVGIPPRPYFRPMIQANSPSWPAAVGANLVATRYDAEATLIRMGAGISEELKVSISNVYTPPLSPVTLMLRKMKSKDQSLRVNKSVVAEARARVARGESYGGVSTKPLVDSGDMINAVDFEVRVR